MQDLNSCKDIEAIYQCLTVPQQEAIALHLRGFSNNEIARKVGVHFQTVSNWRQKPAWQAAIAYWEEEQLQKFRAVIYGNCLDAYSIASHQLLKAIAQNDWEKAKAINSIVRLDKLMPLLEGDRQENINREINQLNSLELALEIARIDKAAVTKNRQALKNRRSRRKKS